MPQVLAGEQYSTQKQLNADSSIGVLHFLRGRNAGLCDEMQGSQKV